MSPVDPAVAHDYDDHLPYNHVHTFVRLAERGWNKAWSLTGGSATHASSSSTLAQTARVPLCTSCHNQYLRRKCGGWGFATCRTLSGSPTPLPKNPVQPEQPANIALAFRICEFEVDILLRLSSVCTLWKEVVDVLLEELAHVTIKSVLPLLC